MKVKAVAMSFFDGNSSVFAVKHHSSAVFLMLVLKYCATGRVKRGDARSWLLNMSMDNVN